MATGMKLWLFVTLTGFGLACAWLLPPEAYPPRDVEVTSAEGIRYGAIEADFHRTSETLRRVVWIDRLSEQLVRDARDGFAVVLPESDEINADQRERFRSKVREEIASLPVRGSEVVFGYAMLPHDEGREPDMAVGGGERVETFVGSREGVDYCLQVRVFREQRLVAAFAGELLDTDLPRPREGVVGACRMYLEHGLPGAEIEAWLERGGIHFGIEIGQAPPTEWWRLGRARGNWVNRPLEADRCLAGRAEACATIFEHPAMLDPILTRDLGLIEATPAVSVGTPSVFRAVPFEGEYLLGDLEREFGPEAFRAFWTSDAPPAAAFQGAFGTDAGTWTRDWIERTSGIAPGGPGLPRSASSGSVLTIGLLLGVAFLRTRRRRLP